MQTVTFLITIECPDEVTDETLARFLSNLENEVYKNNYALHSSEWYDE